MHFFVYIVVKICQRDTFLSAAWFGKIFENRQKHLRRRIGGAADFVKLGLNNRNHSENCYRLSLNRKQKSCTSYADIKFLVLQVTYGRLYWEKGNARPREENKLKWQRTPETTTDIQDVTECS